MCKKVDSPSTCFLGSLYQTDKKLVYIIQSKVVSRNSFCTRSEPLLHRMQFRKP